MAAKQISDQQLETASFRFRTTRRPPKKAICTARSSKSCSRCRARRSASWRSVGGLLFSESH
nr:hypothetical protein [Klebsiella pneumoniae subsp. pneumoniae]